MYAPNVFIFSTFEDTIMKNYAVLTGDIISSQNIEAETLLEVLDWLKSLVKQFESVHSDSIVGTMEVFRGDSWQVCLSDPALVLKAAVFFRAGLKSHSSRLNLDTRIGMGVGPVEQLRFSNISESNGIAFQISGQALDQIGHASPSMKLLGSSNLPSIQMLDQLVLPLLDIQISEWTHPESVAAFGAMLGWTQDQTAAHSLAVKADGHQPTRQSIQRALERIHWRSHIADLVRRSSKYLQNYL